MRQNSTLSAEKSHLNWKRIAFWATLFYFFYTYPTEGETKPVSLKLSQHIASASAYKRTAIRVEWRIPRHPDNRRWEFSFDSDNGDYGSSEGRMDGVNSNVVFPVCLFGNERPCLKMVAPGHYLFVVCLYRTTETFCDKQTLEVRGE